MVLKLSLKSLVPKIAMAHLQENGVVVSEGPENPKQPERSQDRESKKRRLGRAVRAFKARGRTDALYLERALFLYNRVEWPVGL